MVRVLLLSLRFPSFLITVLKIAIDQSALLAWLELCEINLIYLHTQY